MRLKSNFAAEISSKIDKFKILTTKNSSKIKINQILKQFSTKSIEIQNHVTKSPSKICHSPINILLFNEYQKIECRAGKKINQ